MRFLLFKYHPTPKSSRNICTEFETQANTSISFATQGIEIHNLKTIKTGSVLENKFDNILLYNY